MAPGTGAAVPAADKPDTGLEKNGTGMPATENSGKEVETSGTGVASVPPTGTPAGHAAPPAASPASYPASPATSGTHEGIGMDEDEEQQVEEGVVGSFKNNNQTKNWANLFKDNRKTKQEVMLDQYEARGQRLTFAFDDIDDMESTLGHCLVGCFMGRHPGRRGVRVIADRWRIPYKFFMHQSGWIVYKFETKDAMEDVLQGGPYFAFGVPIFLKVMPRCFLFDEDTRWVPAWIQIHGLPPDCWSQKVLSMIGSEVGKPLYTDKLTRTRERLVYARLMVEVPALGERVTEVPIELPTGAQLTLRIIYESSPAFCGKCRKLGHSTEGCQEAMRQGQNQAHPNGRRSMNPNGRGRSQSTRGRGATRGSTQGRREWRPRQQEANPQPEPIEVEQEQVEHEEQDEENYCRDLVPVSPIPLAVVYNEDPEQDQETQTPTPDLHQTETPKEGNEEERKEGDDVEDANLDNSGPWQQVKGRRSFHRGETSNRGVAKESHSTIQTRARAARGGGK